MKSSLFIITLLVSITTTISIEYYPPCSSFITNLLECLRSIGVDASFSNRNIIAILNGISNYSGTAEQNTQLLNLLKQGKLIESNSEYEEEMEIEMAREEEEEKTSSSFMLFKLVNNQNYRSKGETFKFIGEILFDAGYPASFIAGILGNIYHEGNIGKFENSAYIKNPSAKPQYLKYMDQLYDYRNKYSNKIITQVSMNDLSKVFEELKKNNYTKGQFGLGCVQWTGSRAYNLFKLYQKACGYADKISLAQAASAEGKMIINELREKEGKEDIYNEWFKHNSDINTAEAADKAGEIICKKFEKPKNLEEKAKERRKTAKEIYNIMTR